MSPVSPAFHTAVTVSIGLKKHLTLFRPSLILEEQDWVRASIHLIMKGRLRHVSGPAHFIKSVTYRILEIGLYQFCEITNLSRIKMVI